MNDFKNQTETIERCNNFVMKEISKRIKELLDDIPDEINIEVSIGWGFNKKWVEIRHNDGNASIKFRRRCYWSWITPSTPKHYLFLRKNWRKITQKINKQLNIECKMAWKKAQDMNAVISVAPPSVAQFLKD